MEIQNAKIEGTFLGYEDHGILTCSLELSYGDSKQGFGGYDLRYKDYGLKFIENILKVVGVETWESLEGKHLRVKREGGWNGKIIAIGNLLEDKWFSPENKN